MIKLIILWLSSIIILPVIAMISPFEENPIKLLVWYGDIIGAVILYVLITIRLVKVIQKKTGKIMSLFLSIIAVLFAFIFGIAFSFICLSFGIIRN